VGCRCGGDNTKLKKYTFIYVCLIISIVLFLVYNLPVAVHPNYRADDGLMYKWAQSILKGQWLGEYNRFTLTKGPTFSIFIAGCSMLHLPYTVALMSVYTIGTLIFSTSVKKLFNSEKSFIIMFTILIFNPIAYGEHILQIVYRLGFSLGISLMVLGFYIYLFLSEHTHEWSKKVLLCGLISFFFPLMLYARDDSMWIIPFMMVAIICIVIQTWWKEKSLKKTFAVAIIAIFPFISAFGVKSYISYQNYTRYGIYCVTDSKDTYFSRCISLMYSIKDDSEWQRVYVTRETLEKMCDASPTLAKVKSLNNAVAANRGRARNSEHGEIEGTWFYWSLRAAVEQDGYYESAQVSEEFYAKVYEELLSAVNAGTLQTRDYQMPSIFMMPWKEGTGKLLINQLLKTIRYVQEFDDLKVYGVDITLDADETIDDIIEMAHFCNVNSYADLQQDNNENLINSVNMKANIINMVMMLYKKLNPPIFLLSLVFGFIFMIKEVKQLIHRDFSMLRHFLILIGLVSCFMLIVGGVSYVEVTDYSTINYAYLSQAYSIILSIEFIVLYIGITELKVCFIKSMQCRVDKRNM
jgi:hypothetical protein